jgi:hypothetical protein
LLFSFINPKFLILPGTEGMKEYKDYFFHFKGFLKGSMLSVIFGSLFSFIISLF